MSETQFPPWGSPQKDGINDLPLPPPKSVAETIPPFHLHDERNCGDHLHDASSVGFKEFLTRYHKDESTAWNAACTICHTRATLNQLHDLPCGDMLCRGCLLMKALRIKVKIDKNHANIQEARKTMVEIDHQFAETPKMDAQERSTLARRLDQARRDIVRFSGFACCGVNMGLDRFLSCMSPTVSRELWLGIQWVLDAPRAQRACAWPDCGAYLPVCCKYSLPDEAARRWYCVTCEANSMDCARRVEVTQTRFPFLPKGQHALTPAR